MSLSSEAGAARPRLSLLRIFLTIYLPFASAYFVSYVFRSVNAVMSGRLTEDLGLSASDLGLLTAAYFLSFACFQLPLGVLLDRYGPRRVQSVLLLVAAAGALVFSVGQDLGELVAGRILIGFGVAGCLMAAFKAVALWFPQERWPLMNGCMLGMGGLGAVTATAPVEAALEFTDWRGIFAALAGLTVVVAAAIFLVVPERRDQPAPIGLREQLAGLRAIFASRIYWAMMPMLVTVLGTSMAIQSLWAGPWLRDVGDLDRAAVADYLLIGSLALTVGFVAGGLIAEAGRRLGIGLARILIVGMAIFLLIQLVIVLRLDPQGVWPWVLFGFVSNLGTVYGYPLLARHFPLAYAGRANTAINVAAFFAVFAVQYAIGGILDLWRTAEGERYPPEAYSVALGLFLALQVAATLWYLAFRPRDAQREGR